MAEKDLIPFKPKGDPRSDELRSRQKGSASPKRKLAQQRRRRYERIKNMSAEELEKRGLEILSDPKGFDLEILFLIQELLKEDMSDKIKLDLIGKMTQVKGAIWGTVSKNLNVNISKTTANRMQAVWEIIEKEDGTINRKSNIGKSDKDEKC